MIMDTMENSEKPLFYIFNAEVIPVLVTLLVAMEPLYDMLIDTGKITIWQSGYVLSIVLAVVYFGACAYYVRKGFTTVLKFLATTTRMLIFHFSIGAVGCWVAYLANDFNQIHILVLWVGFVVFDYYNTDKEDR